METLDRLKGILDKLEGVSHGSDGQYKARCPAHEDNRASLSVKLADDGGKVLINCFAGCKADDVLRAIGLTWADVSPSSRRVVTTYPYLDEQGNLLFEAVRYEPKDFRQRRPDGKRGWIHDLKGVRRVLYRLPQVLEAIKRGAVIFIAEGEKDVQTLEKLGLVATTNAMGAGKWRPEYTASLRGARLVVICGDADGPGRAHAETVAQSLHDAGVTVVVLELPGPGKDVTDWVSAGGTREALEGLYKAQTPWSPSPAPLPSRANGAYRAPQSDGRTAAPAADTSRANGAFRAVQEQSRWPEPLRPEAFQGLVGKVVRTLEPHTEADPAAILVQLLTLFGNVIGRQPHAAVNGAEHPGNLNILLVGKSSKARKGTSLKCLQSIFKRVDSEWQHVSGLSSGEGLIWAVRDPIIKEEKDKEGNDVETVVDEGVQDKRLLVTEEEFSNVLTQMERDGNTLSPVMRQAWDSGDLSVLTKNNRAKATGAHISIIGHITKDELLRKFTATEMANGFGNRFLFVCAMRSKLLPDGGQPPDAEMVGLLRDLQSAVQFAQSVTLIARDRDAAEFWRYIYGDLSRDRDGLAGSLLQRAEAQVLRLSCLYALLDRSLVVRVEHLKAALAVWEYIEDSVESIFGDSLGDPDADEILRTLRGQPAGMTRDEIRNFFQRHKKSEQISRALATLHERGLARTETTATAGRPCERWFAVAQGARKARYAREAPVANERPAAEPNGAGDARKARYAPKAEAAVSDEVATPRAAAAGGAEEVFEL